jgi:hypothetical protein
MYRQRCGFREPWFELFEKGEELPGSRKLATAERGPVNRIEDLINAIIYSSRSSTYQLEEGTPCLQSSPCIGAGWLTQSGVSIVPV